MHEGRCLGGCLAPQAGATEHLRGKRTPENDQERWVLAVASVTS